MNQIDRLTEWITGARRGEIVRTLSCFLAMFLLLTSYYTIKPLRNSMLNREFSPDSLKDLFLAIPFISLVVTRIFNWFYDRLPKFRLIFGTYGLFIACKVAFMLLLPAGGKLVTLTFYFWLTVYFLLAISILWGTFSTIFDSEAGERVFPFINFGAMTGALAGSWLCGWLATSPFKSQTLLVSALTMGAVLLFLALALKHTPDYVDRPPVKRQGKQRHNVLADLGAMWQNRYVRSIAVMIFAMGFMNLVIEFRAQKEIDLRLSEQAYQQNFKPLNDWLCQHQPCEAGLHIGGFETIARLRLSDKAARPRQLQTWLTAQRAPFQAQALMPAYTAYRDALDGKTQGYLAGINFWINVIGMFLLLVVARPMFHLLGVRNVLIQLPLVYLAVAAVLFYPVGLGMLGLVMIVTGTLNYSLNKTAKELLYTQADDEARFRFKPLIDGPVVRMGDVSAAVMSKVCMDVLMLSAAIGNMVLLIGGIGMSSWWLLESFSAGKEYQRRKADAEPTDRAQV